jgi:lysophospholipase L1-like esterase
VAEGSRYVALGSSYAAGTNIPAQGPVCGRSDRNYPNLVAAALQLELVDVSCSSATTANLLSEPQGDLAPQVEAVTADTELVTITAGGNDVQYILTALTCGQAPESCVPTLDTATIDAAVADLPSRLEALAVAVRERAPDAAIMLVTYLQVVPPEGAECALLQLDADEAAYVSDLGQRLDQAFRTAADATDMVLVDAYSPTAGHGQCTADGAPWMSGFDGGPEGVFYHPTAAGHQAMADLVVDAIGSSQ